MVFLFIFECNVLVHAFIQNDGQSNGEQPNKEPKIDPNRAKPEVKVGFVKLVPASCGQMQPVAASFCVLYFVFCSGVQTGYS